MKIHRYTNQRTVKRVAGRFARWELNDVIGQPFNNREQQCLDCNRRWTPLVKSGVCLSCRSTNTQDAPPTVETQKKIERYNEIMSAHPFGIDPRDKALLAEAQALYNETKNFR